MGAKIILCDCLGSQRVHPGAVASTGAEPSRVHRSLCMDEGARLADELAAAGPGALVACGQEMARLTEIAEAAELPAPGFVDLRDRAGWSDEAERTGPKQAALVADALLGRPDTPVMDVVSGGLCLVLGPAERSIPAATRLADALSVTVLLPEPAEPPLDRRFDLAVGRLRSAAGALGGFEVAIDALRALRPGGREATFGEPRDGATSRCDVILDLTGGTPLFPAHAKREGYLRPDPRDPQAVADAILAASGLVGTFEKPLHVRLEPALCAHSRASQPACSNCLEVCPTGAIASAGEHVAIDPMVCAGCGACAAVCPSQAIAYDDPPVAHLFRRIETLARTFREAGGRAPRLLVHDAHGAEMIALVARHGAGLPADAIPLDLATVSGFGHAEMLAALGAGFAAVDVLAAPSSDRATLGRERALAEAIAGPGRVRVLEIADPDDLPGALGVEAPPPVEPILPMGTRRQVTRMAARALRPEGGAVALPEGAPYGAVLVSDACTLCHACASLCPSGALGDNPDRPELRFQEDACLQCGLCANVCPEDAITLEPRLDLSDAALSQRVLRREEPAACVECGALFGVQSTIERIVEKLAGPARDVRLRGRGPPDPDVRRLPDQGTVRPRRTDARRRAAPRHDHGRLPRPSRPLSDRGSGARAVARAVPGLPRRASPARGPRRTGWAGRPADGRRRAGRGIWTRWRAGAI